MIATYRGPDSRSISSTAESQGDGPIETILLLHGLAVDHRMWGLQVGALENLGRILAPDLPGFGTQPPLPPPSRTPEGYADWVAGWLVTQGGDPCRVIGYSMGGTLALLLAVRHPRLVCSLVSACGSPCWSLGWRGPVARVAFGALGRVAVEAFRQSILWAFARYGKDRAHEPVLEDMARRADGPTMLALCRALARADYRPLLPEVRVPALVVGGSWDHLAPPSHLRAFAGGLPNARLALLSRATHLLCLARPEQFSDVLVEFLGGPGRRGPTEGRTDHGTF